MGNYMYVDSYTSLYPNTLSLSHFEFLHELCGPINGPLLTLSHPYPEPRLTEMKCYSTSNPNSRFLRPIFTLKPYNSHHKYNQITARTKHSHTWSSIAVQQGRYPDH